MQHKIVYSFEKVLSTEVLTNIIESEGTQHTLNNKFIIVILLQSMESFCEH